MQKKNNKQPELSHEQKKLFDVHLHMSKNEFDYLIRSRARLLDDVVIYWTKGKDPEAVKAEVFAIDATRTIKPEKEGEEEKKISVVFGLYIWYSHKLWRTDYIKVAVNIVEAIEIDHKIQVFERKEWRRKWFLRKERKLQKQKAKVINAKSVIKKVG